MSAESGQFSRWGRGARLTRRVREEPPPGELARVYFDRNATQSAAKRRGSGGMHRRSNAAWVSPQAVRRDSGGRTREAMSLGGISARVIASRPRQRARNAASLSV